MTIENQNNKSFFERLLEIPAQVPQLWNTYQNILGTNQRKLEQYRSVFQTPGTILDFGCSAGNTAKVFLDFDYYGIDIDKKSIDHANQKYKDYPNIKFFALDILEDHFRADFFDYVLFAGTGHHLTDEEFLNIFKILMKNLKPTGEMHFFDIIKQPDKDRFSTRLLTWLDRGKFVRTEKKYDELLKSYQIQEKKIFPSPDQLIKQQDFLYFKIVRA